VRTIQWFCVIAEESTRAADVGIVERIKKLMSRSIVLLTCEAPPLRVPAVLLAREEGPREPAKKTRRFADLAEFQIQIYQSVLFSSRFFISIGSNRVLIITKLLRICQHPFLDDSLDDGGSGLAVCCKLQLLSDVLHELKRACGRVLVVASEPKLLNSIKKYLNSTKFSHERLDGSIIPSHFLQSPSKMDHSFGSPDGLPVC
jgi:hypothetical protein